MYEGLIKTLRESQPNRQLMFTAADTIEELSHENESLAKSVNKASEILRRRWIPVTERLPKEKINTLILADTIAGKMAKVSFLYKDNEGRNCWTGLDVCGLNPFDWQPTHWMPLPQMPKEEA